MRDFSLNRHRDPVARVLDFHGDLGWHFRSARAFFLRILEYSEALKSSLTDEIKKAGESRSRHRSLEFHEEEWPMLDRVSSPPVDGVRPSLTRDPFRNRSCPD